MTVLEAAGAHERKRERAGMLGVAIDGFGSIAGWSAVTWIRGLPDFAW